MGEIIALPIECLCECLCQAGCDAAMGCCKEACSGSRIDCDECDDASKFCLVAILGLCLCVVCLSVPVASVALAITVHPAFVSGFGVWLVFWIAVGVISLAVYFSIHCGDEFCPECPCQRKRRMSGWAVAHAAANEARVIRQLDVQKRTTTTRNPLPDVPSSTVDPPERRPGHALRVPPSDAKETAKPPDVTVVDEALVVECCLRDCTIVDRMTASNSVTCRFEGCERRFHKRHTHRTGTATWKRKYCVEHELETDS